MKTILSSIIVTLLVATASSLAADQPVLRYKFEPGKTNVYTVELESQGDSGKEAITATMLVTARETGQNLTVISMRGQFRTRPATNAMPMMPRFGNSTPTLSSFTIGNTTDFREITIDQQGNVLRSSGDIAFPAPLGQLMTSLVDPLPKEAAKEWTDEKSVYVLDEPWFYGPATAFLGSSRFDMGMPMPGRAAQALLRVSSKTSCAVEQGNDNSVTLKKKLTLTSDLTTGNEPRLSCTGDGEIILNTATGIPQKIELRCKAVAITENVSRRSEYTLRWKLMEGSEREQTIAAMTPTRVTTPKKLTADETTKLLADLKSDDNYVRQRAVRELSDTAEPTPEIISGIASVAKDSDETVRRQALQGLAKLGNKEHVPLLIKALNEGDTYIVSAVAKGLGRIKDPRAADALGDVIASGQTEYFFRSQRTDAVEALGNLGPAAEPIALSLLKEKHIGTRISACQVLKKVGTKRSLSALKQQTLEANKELSEAAAEASRTIQMREQ